MAQIQRTGRVYFGEASLHVIEEGIPREWTERNKWEREFKQQVFTRIIQQLKRIGWTVGPWDEAEHYKPIANTRRTCSKGEHLHAQLEMTGRSIELEMWQSANTPTRPDHKGRYERDKEEVMPYLLRLEMERTRRRISTYLCNVFEGYEFDDSRARTKLGPGHLTALEVVQKRLRESGHYRPELGRAAYSGDAQASGDGLTIEHGMRVYAIDWNGRVITGTAFYDLNAQWTVVTGKYGISYNIWHKKVFVNCPGDLRRRSSPDKRRKRLEQELNRAMAAMDFERAATLRDIIFPQRQQLYVVWHNEHQSYHRAGFSGYTTNQIDAGKFTLEEAQDWVGSSDRNRILPLGRNP